MTGRIIPLRGDPHERIQTLLPWFVTGRLDSDEQAEVAAHLASCPHCREEEVLERRLASEISRMSPPIDQGWSALKARIAAANRRPRWRAGRGADAQSTRRWNVTWLLAAQAAMLIAAVVWVAVDAPGGSRGAYHTLSGPASTSQGNALLMVRPDTTQAVLRADLDGGRARIVDGPTAAGAYVLRVAPADRAAFLTRLRGRPEVIVAEPLDGGAP
jgi:anti-sigma factor RsiW